MTLEEKAKAYDEAIERAKKQLDGAKVFDYKEKQIAHDVRTTTYAIFPELKEGEDELTWLTKYIEEEAYSLSIDIRDNEDRIKLEKLKKSLAWLEKQGKTFTKKDVDNAYLKGVCDTKHELEKQGDAFHQQIVEDAMRDPCEHCKDKCLNCHNFPCIEKRAFEQGKSVFEVSNEEPTIVQTTVVQQKDFAPIEPKFKVGDWVVNNNSRGVYKVTEIRDDEYCLYPLYGEVMGYFRIIDVDDEYRLCASAKDGDVLVNGSNIFIFHFINYARLMGYCHVNTDDGRFYDDIGKNECFCLIDAVVHPATKEQRDILFQKMKEAGYEWDADKKELKKIEQMSTWSEEDEAHLDSLPKRLEGMCKPGATYTATRCSISEDKDWLKSLKDRVGNFDDGYKVGFSAAKHNQWKPSDKQMQLLKEACDQHWESDGLDPLYTLYQDLKKLREE